MSAPTDSAGWQRRLVFAVGFHDLVVAGDRMLGRVSPQRESARLAVVAVIDEALAAGVPVAVVDAELALLAHCATTAAA